jgi:hypothetical protein
MARPVYQIPGVRAYSPGLLAWPGPDGAVPPVPGRGEHARRSGREELL